MIDYDLVRRTPLDDLLGARVQLQLHGVRKIGVISSVGQQARVKVDREPGRSVVLPREWKYLTFVDKRPGTEYAKVVWTVSDVQTAAPGMSDKEAEEWLQANQRYLSDQMCQRGWEVIEDLLPKTAAKT